MISQQLRELHVEFTECENELMILSHQRFECNHALMQCHKYILEQKTKKKRAEHESRMARKLMMQTIGDREYIRIFEVSLVLPTVVSTIKSNDSSILQP